MVIKYALLASIIVLAGCQSNKSNQAVSRFEHGLHLLAQSQPGQFSNNQSCQRLTVTYTGTTKVSRRNSQYLYEHIDTYGDIHWLNKYSTSICQQ